MFYTILIPNMNYTSQSFEESLQENLSLYTTAPEISGRDLFQVHREISIARYALSCQANAYAKAIEILSKLLEISSEEIASDSKMISNVMTMIASIEAKSSSLLASVEKVTNLLGTAVNIDVDKANLRMMLINLPSLVKQSINSITQDKNLAETVSTNLNNKISEMMIAFRFSDGEEISMGGMGQQGILINQYNEMLNSVPTANYSASN